MIKIEINGLNDRLIRKLLPEIDDTELGYANISSIVIMQYKTNKTIVIFTDNERYNKTFNVGIEEIFKILSE